jgi:hypothetical protein
MDAGDTLHRPKMGSHRLIGFEEGSLGEEVQFKVGEEGWKGIGIMPLRYLSCVVGDTKTIGAGSECSLDSGFEQTGRMEPYHGNGLTAIEE